MISFNGDTKIISLSTGTIVLGIRDLWSRWIDWSCTSDNQKYLPAFRSVGGDTIDAGDGTSIPLYTFMLNGWKIRPQEATHTLNVNDGILLVDGGGDPFADTVGSYIVRVNFKQPVQAISFSTGSGGVSSTLAAQLLELVTIHGLVSGTPLVVSPTSRIAGAITQTIGEASGVVTVTRT